ncbi:uncharacterized protein LOC135372454 [Ornithodoros turicata]|uniref:uncharacterized protein LOC135372454 n=1 Tax=Ornithodoros turicata TaxID=34597 RepID=UPI0031387FFF
MVFLVYWLVSSPLTASIVEDIPVELEDYSRLQKNRKVSFLSIPSDPKKKKKWITAIRRDEGKDFVIKKHTKVCSLHFVENDFFANYASGTRRLKEDAVPSVFSFLQKPAKSKRKPPKERAVAHSPVTHTTETASPERCHDLEDIMVDMPTSESGDTLSAPGTDSTLEQQSTICSIDCPGQKEATAHKNTIEELKQLLTVMDQELKATKANLAHVKMQLQEAKEHAAELKIVKQTLFSVSRELKLEKAISKKLEQKVGKQFSVERFKHSNEDMQFYTGLPSYAVFESILKFLNPGEQGENVKAWSSGRATSSKMGRPRSLTVQNEFFLFLVRSRLGLFEKDLADRFCVSLATVSRICITWTSYSFLHLSQLPLWMSKEKVQEEMPPAFREKYSSTRVILDATEIKCQTASSLALQSARFSNYKSTNTFKGLIGMSPDGTVTFVSNLFPGSISDKECVRQSGFLSLPFNEGDIVMADKGFKIQEMLDDIKVLLNTPPFLTRGQFSEAEVQETQEIASLRIHVERRIQRVKNFHIFDRPIPLSLGPVINEMWVVCVILTNFQSPLIRIPEDQEDEVS